MNSLKAFWATAKRELLIRCRYADWFVAMLLWPILMPVFTVFAAQALAGPDNSGGQIFSEIAGTSDYVGFVFIGVVMWNWLNTVLWQVGSTLRTEQRRGTLEPNWVTPASRLAIMSGSGLTSMVSSLMTVAISLIFCKLAWRIDLTFSPFLGLIFLLSTATISQLGGERRARHIHGLLRHNLPDIGHATLDANSRKSPAPHLFHRPHPPGRACRGHVCKRIWRVLDPLRLCSITLGRRVLALHRDGPERGAERHSWAVLARTSPCAGPHPQGLTRQS